jgi:hypothetical protein
MIFAAPWVLLALVLLPILWWLLRVTPPSPRREVFPAIRLLGGLRAAEETPARTPLWLLMLRLLAAALLIVGLAEPILDAGQELAGDGPVLLVVDDGWASSADWPRRVKVAELTLDRAARAGRRTALLTTAPAESRDAPLAGPPMPPVDLRARVAALRPKPWPPDRLAAARALRQWDLPGTDVVYISDGLTHGNDSTEFVVALKAAGRVTEVCCAGETAKVLLPPTAEADRLVARVATTPNPVSSEVGVLAQSGDGRTLARVAIPLPAGATSGEAAIVLPPEMRNRLERLTLQGVSSAGAVVLLDERWRRRPVGLVAGGEKSTVDAPLTGALYYVRRALGPFAELRDGDVRTLLARDLSVLILADRTLPEGDDRTLLSQWVEKGGLLIRFAGPSVADQPDPLLPVTLLQGDRQLGGALSWNQPASLAPFPEGSPFAGLAIPDEVKVARQVLAEPSPGLELHSWARLADGTPLVTERAVGAGRIVLFHVTANADWSNLPLSGLFVDMLRRLAQLAVGVASAEGDMVLIPAQTLDGYGSLNPPPPAAKGIAARDMATTLVSPIHPPGLYGPENGRQALNLGAAAPLPEAAPRVSGARQEALDAIAPERAIGPWLVAAALLILAGDLLISLLLRGNFRRTGTAPALRASLLAVLACASIGAATAAERVGSAALDTRLAYIVTGDTEVDATSRAGLHGLSDFINRRSAANLAEPDAVVPGQDDLSFYPLIYWPVAPSATAFEPPAAAALNDYMSRGGIVLIDTRGGGSGEDFAPGSANALKRVAEGLAIPPLAPLTSEHVLARAFYLLQDFPGRYTGAPVWVQRDQDRANDSVSPVVVGGNDWAAAWAVDAAGRNPYGVIPGGAQQRVFAYRFGLNLVMYALTGNYKGDQVHVPAILERLGQ